MRQKRDDLTKAFVLYFLLLTLSWVGTSCSLELVGAPLAELADDPTVTHPRYKFTTDGTVYAVAHDADGNTYIGGEFTHVNIEEPAQRALLLNTSDASVNDEIDFATGFNGTVFAIVKMNDGSLIFGGAFSHYKGQSVNYIAKLDSAGNLDTTFSPPALNGFNNSVYTLALSGTDLYVGGFFTSYRGQSANRIAKLNSAGTLDTTFSPPAANGFNHFVYAIAVSGSDLYVGGTFTSYYPGGGQSANRIAKLNSVGTLDTTFSPPASNGFNSTVLTLAVSGADLYVGGQFTIYNPGGGQSANRIAKLNSVGTLDTTFSPPAANGFNNLVFELTVSGTDLYVGGAFTTYHPGGGQSANRIAKLNSAGNLDTTFSPPAANGFNSTVFVITISGADLYVGGSFTTYNPGGGQSANRIARLDSNGNLDLLVSSPTANGFNNEVRALLISENHLYLGGTFTTYYAGDEQSANRIAKFTSEGELDTTFSPPGANGFDGAVYALAVSGTDLYVGGNFLNYYPGGGQSASFIAKLDSAGNLDTTFSPPGANGFDDVVRAIAISGTDLYVGGQFTIYNPGGGQSANRIAKLDSAGNLDTTFSPPAANGFDDVVRTIAISGTDLYVGGTFTTYQPGVGQSANYIAKLDSAGNLDTTFSPPGANGFDGTVVALAVSGTDLYVGGEFYFYNADGGHTVNSIAKLDSDGKLDLAFSPPAANGFNSAVFALAVSGTDLYVGGYFTSYNPGGGQSVSSIAKLDSNGNLDTTFSALTNSGFDTVVLTLAISGNALYVGGEFQNYLNSVGIFPLHHFGILDRSSGEVNSPEL